MATAGWAGHHALCWGQARLAASLQGWRTSVGLELNPCDPCFCPPPQFYSLVFPGLLAGLMVMAVGTEGC